MSNNGQKHRRNTVGLRPPWKPGECPNPGGRPKGTSLLAEIRDLLHGKDGKERKEAAKAFVAQLKRGSVAHAKEIIDREEGATPVDGRVVVEFVLTDPRPLNEDPSTN